MPFAILNLRRSKHALNKTAPVPADDLPNPADLLHIYTQTGNHSRSSRPLPTLASSGGRRELYRCRLRLRAALPGSAPTLRRFYNRLWKSSPWSFRQSARMTPRTKTIRRSVHHNSRKHFSEPALDKGWALNRAAGLQILTANIFDRLPWLVHGFSTRIGGESRLDGRSALNLGFTDWDS